MNPDTPPYENDKIFIRGGIIITTPTPQTINNNVSFPTTKNLHVL